ncbi:MAG: phenylacetate--CoA ligase family protein [Candidatus Cloacimonetes bacterium]|nr:phenylacetate--CoA ligase family protein [Candidatus Cloacimonadota bacterium]
MQFVNLYHRLPSFMKDLIASGYGFLQKRRRYGGKFQEYVQQLEESQWYSLEQQKEYQERKLKSILVHAGENVPYYRILFKDLGIDPINEEPFSVLSKLPLLDKQSVRENTEHFVAENIQKKTMLIEHTSGSTGTPLKVYQTNESQQYNYALGEARSFGWAGVKHTDRKVIFGGRLIIPISKKYPPYWVTNYSEKQLYCSSYHISISTLPDYHKKIKEFKPDYITGYTSAIYLYGRYLIDNGKKLEGIKAIISSSETLSNKQRNIIEKAFNCKVYDGYSLTEYVNYISECEHNTLHISPEAGVVEIVNDNYQEVENGIEGEIVSTTLFNYSMPLIRYKTGDLTIKSDKRCACGRKLPVVEKIAGRSDDYIITPEGKKVGRLDPVFKEIDNIVEAQIIQEDINNVCVKIVSASNFSKKDAEAIVNNLQLRIGQKINVSLHKVKNIKRSTNGKFKSVICKIEISSYRKFL